MANKEETPDPPHGGCQVVLVDSDTVVKHIQLQREKPRKGTEHVEIKLQDAENFVRARKVSVWRCGCDCGKDEQLWRWSYLRNLGQNYTVSSWQKLDVLQKSMRLNCRGYMAQDEELSRDELRIFDRNHLQQGVLASTLWMPQPQPQPVGDSNCFPWIAQILSAVFRGTSHDTGTIFETIMKSPTSSIKMIMHFDHYLSRDPWVVPNSRSDAYQGKKLKDPKEIIDFTIQSVCSCGDCKICDMKFNWCNIFDDFKDRSAKDFCTTVDKWLNDNCVELVQKLLNVGNGVGGGGSGGGGGGSGGGGSGGGGESSGGGDGGGDWGGESGGGLPQMGEPLMGGLKGGGGSGVSGGDGMVQASHGGSVNFFQMPRWIANVVWYSIKHNHDVQKKLCDLGYRSFSQLEAFQPSADDGGEVGRGSAHATIYIGGYNIATEIQVQNATWDSAFFSDEMRTLSAQLTEEFHARAFGDELEDSDSGTVQLAYSSEESDVVDSNSVESSAEGLSDMEEVSSKESVPGAIKHETAVAVENDFDVCLSTAAAAGGHGSKHTSGKMDMDSVSDVCLAKKPRLTPAVKMDLLGEERAHKEGEEDIDDEVCAITAVTRVNDPFVSIDLCGTKDQVFKAAVGESTSSNVHKLVQQQQGVEHAKWPRTGAAAHEEAQPAVDTRADSSRRRTDGVARKAEASLTADAAEGVEVRLRLLSEDRYEMFRIMIQETEMLDLYAHTGLLAVPEALWCLTAMHELTVESTELICIYSALYYIF